MTSTAADPSHLMFVVLLWTPVGVCVAGAAIVSARRHDRAAVRWLAACEALVVAVVVCSKTGLETHWTLLNVAFCIAAILASFALYIACWTLKPNALGVAIGVLASVALVPSFALGPLFASFALMDYLDAPMRVANLRPGLSCRVTGWGMSFGDEGYIVHLYRAWPRFPILRREIARVSVDETNPGDGPKSATCESVAAAIGR